MTLHDTAEFSKKGGIAISIGLGVILLIIIFVKVGKFVNSIINPPRIDAPNEVYGKIPSITFPQSTVKGQFTYTINTVNGSLPSDFPDRPIIYPHPPYSTMNFLVASGENQATVVSAIYNHQTVNLQPDKNATYPIKSAQQAFDDLKNGKGYIASYNGSDSQILISNIFLAYYIGVTDQDYLMPVIVFQGQNGFFAYVPAVTNDALQ